MKKYGVFLCFLLLLVNVEMRKVFAETEIDKTVGTETETENVSESTEEMIEDYTVPSIVLELGELGYEMQGTEIRRFFFGTWNEKGKPDIDFVLKASDGGEMSEGETPSGLKSITVELNGEMAYEKVYVDSDSESEVIYEDEIKFNLDAVTVADTYVGSIVVADIFGNETSLPFEIYRDMEGPIVSDVSLSEAISVIADTYFYNSPVSVEVMCEDVRVGVHAIEWGTVDFDTVSEEAGKLELEEIIEVDEEGVASFILKVPEESVFEEVVYVRGIDLLGNVGEPVLLNSIVIETQEQHDVSNLNEPHLIAEMVTETPYIDALGKSLYASDTQGILSIQLTATDIINGVRKIAWEVVSEKGTHEELGGFVDFSESETSTSNGEWNTEEGTDYVKIVDGEVEIDLTKLDANNVIVHMLMEDFSGNQTVEELAFSVDQTAPIIKVEFDDVMPDEEYTNVYNSKRMATISITDRNIDMKQISIDITNSEGYLPEIGEWGFSVDEQNPEQTTCMTTVTFGVDGDYSIAVSCKDMAGHEAFSTDIPDFTIDMTKPVIMVNYQNQDAKNGNYYKAPQVAVIQITEHNFVEDRIGVQGTVDDNGTNIIFPGISGWNSIGDVHTTTITCNADGQYQFDIEYTDMAGNEAERYVGEPFYVDMTPPAIEIHGVEDKSANNGVVAPSISFSDGNFDEDSVDVKLIGTNHGELALDYNLRMQELGQVYEYSDIPSERELDDIYTFTASVSDLAGNASTKSIVFSVNRFGSVYVFGDSLKRIAGSYVQDNVDVRLTEVNVDSLEEDSIRVVVDKNGVSSDLEMGTDYTVAQIDGSGIWHQYEYRIDESVFNGDGRYIVTLYSEDEAGNINENKDETKQAEIIFGIDKTAPNVIPIDIASQEQYDAEEKVATVAVNDNLVLKEVEVYLGDNKCEVLSDGDNYIFQIPNASTRQDITIAAIDAAGNRTNYVINDVLVTTNALIRWYNDKTLFVGSVVAVAVVGIVGTIAIGIVISRRKKK